MKKLICALLLVVIAIASGAAKNQITLKGVAYDVDTLIYEHKVGPGTKFAKYELPAFPLRVHVVEMDLENEYVDFSTCKGGDEAVATETPSSMYARNDKPGHEMIASTNGDFYFYRDAIEIGIPRSGQYREFECVTNPVGRAAFVMDDERNPYIDRVDFAGKVSSGGVETRLHAVNMQRLEWENTGDDFMLLYTNYYGANTENRSGGTKVVITPKEGEFFFSSNKNITGVVEQIYENEGSSEIPEGKALLWGRGASEDFLKTLSVGSEVNLYLGTTLREQPTKPTKFKELVGGSNVIIMRNGKLEDIDTTRHPRTAIGFSADSTKVYYLLFDGRSVLSAGVDMEEAAEVFKAVGAWNAINLDGGGSSCMVVNGDIVNNNSDGKERNVGNGCLIFSTAPEDSEVADLGFAPRSYNLPTMAKLRPKFYGYNKYGMLKTKDLEGVVLTCDSNIGSINDKGEFVAAATACAGNLTATYNGVSVTQQVYVMPAEIGFKIKDLLIDNHREYEREVFGTNGVYKDMLDPSLFDWESSDVDVCTVEDGILKGVGNGQAVVYGEIGDFKGSINVTVQIAPSHIMPIDPTMDTETWNVAQVGGKDRVITPLENGMKIEYTGVSGRAPYLRLNKQIQLWSLPDTIQIRINPGDAPINDITISSSTATNEVVNSVIEDIIPNEINYIKLPTAQWCDVNDLANFPISISRIQFSMGTSKTGQKYEVLIPGIEAIYKSVPASVEGILADKGESKIAVFPNPVNSGSAISIAVQELGATKIMIYNAVGRLVNVYNEDNQSGVIRLNNPALEAGVYYIKVVDSAAMESSVKLLVK